MRHPRLPRRRDRRLPGRGEDPRATPLPAAASRRAVDRRRDFYSWTAWDQAQGHRRRPGLAGPDKPKVRGGRRQRLVDAAREGLDLDDIDAVPEAFDERDLPVVHVARLVEYDVPDRNGNGEFIRSHQIKPRAA